MARLEAGWEDESSPEGLRIAEYLEIIQRQKWLFLIVLLGTLGSGLVVIDRRTPIYQAATTLLIGPSGTSISVSDASNPVAPMLAALHAGSLGTQVELLRSRSFQNEAMRRIGMAAPAEEDPSPVSVEVLPDSTVVQIRVEGPNPHQIAGLADAMVDLFLERAEGTTATGIGQARAFLEKSRTQAAGELAAAEQRLLAFRREHEILDLMADQTGQARAYAELQGEVGRLESTIASARARIAALEASLAGEPVEVVQESPRENARRARLEARLHEVQLQRMDQLREFRPTSRQIRDLNTQIEEIQEQLRSEPPMVTVRSREPNRGRQALQARLRSLQMDLRGDLAAHEAAVARLEARKEVLSRLSALEVKQSRLIQERDAALVALQMWSARLRDLDARSRTRVQSARVVDRAVVPKVPVRPNKLKYIAMCVVLALTLAVGSALLREYRDGRVHSPNQVERVSALPAVGHIPAIPPAEPLLVATLPPDSLLTESYRMLRVGLPFDEHEATIQCLVVTSPGAREGKTTTAVNLATALALDGKRVLLVDADFRNSSVAQLFHLVPTPGLSELLMETMSLSEAIQTTPIENLQIISAGLVPDNPARLLASSAFSTLVTQLRERADVVMFDTPPCLLCTDALFVSARMDGALLVVQMGKTEKQAVQDAEELLARTRVPLLGVLINGVRQGRRGYYHRGARTFEETDLAGSTERGGPTRSNGHRPWPDRTRSGEVVSPSPASGQPREP